MEPSFQTTAQQDEISLKEIIVSLKQWIRFLFSRWLVILIVGMLGAGLGLFYALSKKPQYVAELSFVLEDSKSNSLGGYAGLASQFGIDLGGGSASGVFSGDNIIEFLRSRLMVEKTLLSTVTANGAEKTLVDFYLDINELRDKWKKPELKKVSFPVGLSRDKFSVLQDSVLNVVYLRFLRKELVVAKPDKKLSFIVVKCMSENEFFAKSFTERLVKEATDFYVQTKTQRSKASVDKLQFKADSLETLLNRKTYSAAVAQDLNLNPARSIARVESELVNRDKTVLMTMYAEVVKNLEISRMSMAQETPIIQIVDRPILPLREEKFSKLKGIIAGGVLAGFLTICWLIVRRMYRNIMA